MREECSDSTNFARSLLFALLSYLGAVTSTSACKIRIGIKVFEIEQEFTLLVELKGIIKQRYEKDKKVLGKSKSSLISSKF